MVRLPTGPEAIGFQSGTKQGATRPLSHLWSFRSIGR